jgi:GTP:adenosylcobinamide-phosphate guanylyltransferase
VAETREWTAIVMAGDRAGGDPLARHFGVPLKALVPVAGEAMVSRVTRTLLAAPAIARVVILAQAPERVMQGDAAWLAEDSRVVGAPSGQGLADAIEAVAGTPAAPFPILVTTADHPLLTVATIAHFLDAGSGADVAFGAVERRVMDAAHPDNKRTWQRFKGGAYTGANLFALTGPRALAALDLYRRIEADRKRPLKLLRHFGFGLALRAATRSIPLQQALDRVGRRTGISVKLVELPDAEAGIDVDKLSDHEQVEAILRGRSAPRR